MTWIRNENRRTGSSILFFRWANPFIRLGIASRVPEKWTPSLFAASSRGTQREIQLHRFEWEIRGPRLHFRGVLVFRACSLRYASNRTCVFTNADPALRHCPPGRCIGGTVSFCARPRFSRGTCLYSFSSFRLSSPPGWAGSDRVCWRRRFHCCWAIISSSSRGDRFFILPMLLTWQRVAILGFMCILFSVVLDRLRKAIKDHLDCLDRLSLLIESVGRLRHYYPRSEGQCGVLEHRSRKDGGL